MNTLANALGSKFIESKDQLRIRTFDFQKVTFKIKVPLTVESDLMFEKNKIIDETIVQKYYDEMAKEFIDNKEKYANEPDIVYETDNIIVKGKT